MFVFDLVPLHHWTEIVGLGNSPFKDYSGWWNQIIYRIVSPPKRLKVICVFWRRVFLVEEKTNWSMCSWSKKTIWWWFRICLVCLFVFCLVVWLFVSLFFCLYYYYVHLCSIPSCERSHKFTHVFSQRLNGYNTEFTFYSSFKQVRSYFQSYLLAYPRFCVLFDGSESFP